MKIIKISAIIIGSIIGAGFASGKEIFEYFAKYGIISLFFIIPLFIFFSFFIYIYLKFGNLTKGLEFKNASNLIGKEKKIFGIKFNPYNLMLFASFLILCSAMFSGLVALMETYFPYDLKPLFMLIAIIITYALLNLSFNKIGWISNLIVPLIILCLILNVFCSFYSGNFCLNFGLYNFLPLPFLIVLYVSQNTFFCSVIISKLGKDLTKKEMLTVSFIVSGVICVLVLLGILCFLFNPKLIYADMPFAEVAIRVNPIFSVIFAVILFGSIITTYMTSLNSLQSFFYKQKKHKSNIMILLLIVLLSLFNFGKIIEYLYPIIGAIGLLYFYKVFSYNKRSMFNFAFQKPNKEIHSASQ